MHYSELNWWQAIVIIWWQFTHVRIHFVLKPSSTSLCCMALEESSLYYVNQQSSVFCTRRDASKAFDRLEYCKLFKLLFSRQRPAPVIGVLIIFIRVIRITFALLGAALIPHYRGPANQWTHWEYCPTKTGSGKLKMATGKPGLNPDNVGFAVDIAFLSSPQAEN
jgi:hypothetical protein